MKREASLGTKGSSLSNAFIKNCSYIMLRDKVSSLGSERVEIYLE